MLPGVFFEAVFLWNMHTVRDVLFELFRSAFSASNPVCVCVLQNRFVFIFFDTK